MRTGIVADMLARPLILFVFLWQFCASALAAASAQALTPMNTSVLGGERQVYSVRFLDAAGQPAVGESVIFDNDACGFFDNGSFVASTRTDANGVASVGFTARAQGITCWITAQAGASVRFNVFTYTLGQVSIAGSQFPAEPRPGEAFKLTAGANAGVYPIYNAEISARVIPGTGSAAIAPASGNSGQSGRVDFTVTPQGLGGDFEIEVAFRSVTRRFAVRGAASPLQDMWWSGAAENGWGVSVVQHDDRLFAAIYAYDTAGAPTWYVMPNGTWNAAHTAFTGALYAPHGTPYSSYDASKLVAGAARGNATLTFNGADQATLAYTIDGVTATRAITRQLFGPTESTAAPRIVGDMWWGGAAQNGWGIALLQQYRTIFGVWFTYDASGAPTWFVMPSGFWNDASTWQGRLYRATGSPWLGHPYDPARLVIEDVGTFTLRFDGDTAAFTYTVDGKTGTMALMRQPF